MPMAIPDAFLQQLRDMNPIEGVVSSYVPLRRAGRNLVGLCPFHGEKTPSFTVYPHSDSFYCFGCGAGGDTVTFVKLIENLDYIEAVRFLAEKVALVVPENAYDDGMAKRRMRVLEANREAARFFHQCLMGPEGAEGLHYFLGRGLLKSTIRHFGLGYAPESWNALLSHMSGKGFSEEDLYDADLVKKKNGRYFDNFRHRVMVPIIDLRGNIVAFGGRVLDDSKPKYVNTADTPAYKKSSQVFALNFAKNQKQGQLILAEGYMDVIALHQAGFAQAVASLGTALTGEQARNIARYAQEVVIIYDADAAGQEATRKAIPICNKAGLKVRVLRLTGAKDPDEFIKRNGADRFRALLDGALNDIEYRLLKEKEKFDTTTDDGKIAYLRAASGVLAELPGPVEREVYAGRLAEELGVSKDAVLSQIEYLYKGKKRQKEARNFKMIQDRTAARNNTVNPEKGHFLKAARAEEGLLSLLMNNPDFLEHIEKMLSVQDFVTDFNRRVYEKLRLRLQESRSLDLALLSGDFSSEEMGELARIQALHMAGQDDLRECNDYIQVILAQKELMTEKKPAEMTAQELTESFVRLAKYKGGKKENES